MFLNKGICVRLLLIWTDASLLRMSNWFHKGEKELFSIIVEVHSWKAGFSESQLFSHLLIIFKVFSPQAFLAFLWFGSSPTPSPTSPFSKLSLLLSLPVCCRSSLMTGRGRAYRGGAESYDNEKAWSSINYSLSSGLFTMPTMHSSSELCYLLKGNETMHFEHHRVFTQ